ncbi:hypothetical protein CHS0354_016368 [Potamilus streckersoni]|uniref:C2H2-type domain-containing protein n=1 Tax=Potamilus streckersoni TaxID=2493646 RepID=A0AAE0SW18_9BIVA|nr:hypothetical protein CHS0354_016368 [Potamilus streckersoni]
MGSADVKGIIYLSANILQIYETIRAKANKDSDAFIEHLLNLHVRWAQRKIGISVAETLARRFSGIEQEMKMNSDSLMEHLISLYNGEFDGVKDEHGDVEDYSQDASSSSSIPESFLSHYRSKEIPYMSRSVTSNPLKSSHCRKDRDQLLKESSHVTDTSTFPSITNDSVLPSIHLSNAAGERSNKSLEHFEMSGEYEEVGTKRRTSEQCHNPVFFGTSFNSAYQPSGKDSETLKQSSDLSVGNDACYSLHSVSHNGTDFPKNMDTLPEDLIIVNIKEEMDASNFELTGVDQGEKVGREKATNSIQQITGVGDNESNNFTLTDSVRFQDLQQSVHVGGKTKTYKCFICQKQFRTLSTYRYHVPTHKTQQGFKCRLCSHIFPCLSLLRFHMRSHTENNTSTSAVHLDDLERDTTVVGSYEPLPGELEWISEDEDQLSVTTDDSKDLEGTVSNLVDNRLDEWKSSGKSASTQNTDRWAVNRFQEWQVRQGITIDFATVEPRTLALNLRKFYAEIRTKEGKLLTPVGLRGIRCAIQRILMAPPYKRAINIVSDEEFRPANEMFEERCKLYLKWNDAAPKHHPKIKKMDMEKLRYYFQPSESPEMLQHTVWFLLFYNFGKKRLEKWNCMNKGSFLIKIDGSGREYLTYNMSQSHLHLQDLSFWDNDEERVYGSNSDGSIDIIQVYKFYLSKLNPKCNSLFQRVKKTWEVDGIWFDAAPLGKNCLKEFMKNISRKASLSYIYTNHCVRVTAIADIYPEGTEPVQILGISEKS